MARNQYPGACYRCQQIVPPFAGHYERYKGAWRVQHAECAIAYRGTPRDATGPRPWVDPRHNRTLRSLVCACGIQFTTRIYNQVRCAGCNKSRKAQRKVTDAADS